VNHPVGIAAAIVDPLALARDLIRRPSVTPRDEGAIELIAGNVSMTPMRGMKS